MSDTKNDASTQAQPAGARKKSWRNCLKVHPAADLFELMSADELKALGEDIDANGLKIPIILFEQEKGAEAFVLDGRNRLDAIEAQSASPIVDATGHLIYDARFLRIEYVRGDQGIDPYAYVVSANIHRRHLTPELKRKLIAKLIKADPTRSNRRIADQVKASHPHVAKVRAELEKSGDVETVSTSIDTKGRKQPAKKPPTPAPEGLSKDEPPAPPEAETKSAPPAPPPPAEPPAAIVGEIADLIELNGPLMEDFIWEALVLYAEDAAADDTDKDDASIEWREIANAVLDTLGRFDEGRAPPSAAAPTDPEPLPAASIEEGRI